MPRKKAHSTQKPPLLFAEPPRGGPRNRTNVPEVRAAINPKSFITEGHSRDGSNSTLTTWVSPQFDAAHLAAAPARRGRRQCHSTTGVADRSTQLTRGKKKSVCQRYPTLAFKRRTQEQPHQLDRARGKKATEPTAVSIPERQQQEVTSQAGRPVSSCRSAQEEEQQKHVETPKRSCSTLRRRSVVEKKSAGLYHDGPSCSSSRLELRDGAPPSVHLTGKRRISTTPTTTESPRTPDVPSPPDVDTPEVLHEEEEGGGSGSRPSSAFLDLLFSSSELSASPGACHGSPRDVLVADTPERDYGLKVTWRRRRELMVMLKQRGSLSDADVLTDC